MTKEWLLKGKGLIVHPDSYRAALYQKVDAYPAEEIETLRKKLIEDIRLIAEKAPPTSRLSTMALVEKQINKRFGVEEHRCCNNKMAETIIATPDEEKSEFSCDKCGRVKTKIKVKKHKEGGIRCLVIHHDGDGGSAPQCIMCENCKKWIEPNKMGEKCGAR